MRNDRSEGAGSAIWAGALSSFLRSASPRCATVEDTRVLASPFDGCSFARRGMVISPSRGAFLSTSSITDQLVGTYALRSFELRRSDGSVAYPFGQDAVGLITYDEAGRVAVQMMRLDRPLFVSADMLGGTSDEIAAAWAGFLSYAGQYEVDQVAGTVTHQVEMCSFPNWVGGDQVRHYQLDGSMLELTTPPLTYGGNPAVAALVWERA